MKTPVGKVANRKARSCLIRDRTNTAINQSPIQSLRAQINKVRKDRVRTNSKDSKSSRASKRKAHSNEAFRSIRSRCPLALFRPSPLRKRVRSLLRLRFHLRLLQRHHRHQGKRLLLHNNAPRLLQTRRYLNPIARRLRRVICFHSQRSPQLQMRLRPQSRTRRTPKQAPKQSLTQSSTRTGIA